MKIFICALLAAACLVKLSEGYLCYECNSTYDETNCFSFSPTDSYYKAVHCDVDGTGVENCYAVKILDRKKPRMYRGCKRSNVCEVYENQETSQYKVITCSECNEHYCNSSDRLPTSIMFTLSLSLVAWSLNKLLF